MKSMDMVPIPKLIFLDAVGTLFTVKGTVGQTYSRFAAEFGCELPPEKLEKSFRQAFKQSSAPISTKNYLTEEQWWRSLVNQTFDLALDSVPFPQFNDFFDAVFEYFATSDAWVVYPEVHESLRQWSDQGIWLGIISNFDSRLYRVLDALGLSSYFSSVTISFEVGVAKPNPKIFQAALSHYDCLAQEALHIGDQREDDYLGSIAVGIQGVWLSRDLNISKNGNFSKDHISENFIRRLDDLKWCN